MSVHGGVLPFIGPPTRGARGRVGAALRGNRGRGVVLRMRRTCVCRAGLGVC